MARGTKTGGRVAGVKNKKVRERLNGIADSGLTPLEYLLSVMRAPIPIELQGLIDSMGGGVSDDMARALSSWHAQRVDAAKAAAPYIHPKLNAIHTTTTDTSKTFEQWLTEIDDNDDGG